MILSARNRNPTKLMLESELLSCLTQQFLKQRILQVRQWHHKSPPLFFFLPNIDHKMPSRNVRRGRAVLHHLEPNLPVRRRAAVSDLLSVKNDLRQTNTHFRQLFDEMSRRGTQVLECPFELRNRGTLYRFFGGFWILVLPIKWYYPKPQLGREWTHVSVETATLPPGFSIKVHLLWPSKGRMDEKGDIHIIF